MILVVAFGSSMILKGVFKSTFYGLKTSFEIKLMEESENHEIWEWRNNSNLPGMERILWHRRHRQTGVFFKGRQAFWCNFSPRLLKRRILEILRNPLSESKQRGVSYARDYDDQGSRKIFEAAWDHYLQVCCWRQNPRNPDREGVAVWQRSHRQMDQRGTKEVTHEGRWIV